MNYQFEYGWGEYFHKQISFQMSDYFIRFWDLELQTKGMAF